MFVTTQTESQVDEMTITLNVEICKEKLPTFSDLEKAVFDCVTNMGCQMIAQILEEQDNTLRQERDKSRYRCKGKRKTSIKTKLGVVEYRRNVYEDTTPGGEQRFVHLLDRELELETVGLISSEVCRQAIQSACESSYRGASRQISETTGLSISPQGIWNMVQKVGETRKNAIERYAELSDAKESRGEVETKLLYEENDGVWLKLQGKDRKENGASKEMRVGIAYDGALWSGGKDGKQRRTLHNKISHASFESAADFRRHKEGIIANHFLVDEIQQRVINGDGAAWLKKRKNPQDIPVLDKFHRNKKILECVKNREFAQTLRSLLYENRIDDLLACLEAQINSTQDEEEIKGLKKLLSYYTENKDALLSYYDRGIEIPETSQPGVIHHARLGSMESNVFTLIGNRMKDRRSCWSIAGADNLAGLLCLKYTTGFGELFQPLPPPPKPEAKEEEAGETLPAAKLPERIGKGYEFPHSFTPPQSWGHGAAKHISFSDLRLI